MEVVQSTGGTWQRKDEEYEVRNKEYDRTRINNMRYCKLFEERNDALSFRLFMWGLAFGCDNPRGWLGESNLTVLLLKSWYALIVDDLWSYEGPYDKASRLQEVKSSTKHIIVVLLRSEKAPVRGDSSGTMISLLAVKREVWGRRK